MDKIIVSKKWRLKTRDWLISLFQAAAIPVLVLLQQKIDAAINSGNFNLSIDLKEMGMIAAGAGVIHILRKLMEPSKIIKIKKLP